MQHRPLLVWAIAFAAGIGISAAGWLPPAAALCLTLLGLAALAARRWPVLFPIALLLLGLSAGALRLSAFQTVGASDISHWADKPFPLTITGTIASDPETRPGGRLSFFSRRIVLRYAAEPRLSLGRFRSGSDPTPRWAGHLTMAAGFSSKACWRHLSPQPTPALSPGAIIWPGGPSTAS